MININNDEYLKLVKKHKPKEPKLKNSVCSFLVGGILGMSGEFICRLIGYLFHLSKEESCIWTLLTIILITCLLTSLHIFDNLVQKFQAGLIVPITGFAHSICSSSLEYKKDGAITGLGSNVFKLAGSVLLYGIISAFILCLIKVVIYD